MNHAGRLLVGRHDFHSFETDWPNRTSSVRTVVDLAVERSGAFVTIEVEADGFLYNMVRSIAGTLMLVGAGKHPPGWVAEVLAAQSRAVAGPTAPPQGYSWSKSIMRSRSLVLSPWSEIVSGQGSTMRIVHVITRLIIGGAQENTLLTVEGLARSIS